MLRERKIGSDSEALLDRPLSARSLVASLLLRTRPPRMRGGRLVQWCELFGVAEGTTRVALSRMVERGELRASDGVYEIAGRVQRRKGAQDWSLDPELVAWTGEWRTAMVAAGSRNASERAELRDTLRRLRFAPLREGVWTRPDNLATASGSADWWKVVDDQCTWWSGRPDEDAATLAEELFACDAWSARAGMLVARLTSATRALIGSEDGALADGFVVGAAALAHIRVDPLLPAELVDDASIGDALRTAYRAYEDAFSSALRSWFLDR